MVKKRNSQTKKIVALWMILILIMVNIKVVPVSYATDGKNAVVNTPGGNLFVRSGPSSGSTAIAILRDKTKIYVTDSSGFWYKMELDDGETGYVSSKYVKMLKSTSSGSSASSSSSKYPVTARVSNGSVSLRFRQKASTSSAILDYIPRGSSIRITGKYNSNWYAASYNGKNGYVHADYIVMSSGGSSGSSSSAASSSGYAKYKQIQLNVSKYLQNDSRWSSEHLGHSKATIGKSGCTVSCVAMVESYLTGGKVTPKIIAETRQFDEGGRFYWPNDYVVDYTADYMSEIYQQLSRKRPVLVGGFTPGGKQHWVLVTGYTGKHNSRLNLSDFIINDPSGRYETLAEYFSVYSRYYKIAYKK